MVSMYFRGYLNKVKMKISVVCASNQNRSMEAHDVLAKKGFQVTSFGTNSMIKLPGPTANTPNSYPFGTTYESIRQDLLAKDPVLYRSNGMLMLLDRNARIKTAPQRFQDRESVDDELIVTCEERCFDIVAEDLLQRQNLGEEAADRVVHLVNFDIVDSPEEATVGARSILQFVQQIEENKHKDLNDVIPQVYEDFVVNSSLKTLYSVHYCQ